jgi:AraC-like DNA-binding protein
MRGVEGSITSVAALVLIGAAAQAGVPVAPLFSVVGLDPAEPPDPERHIRAGLYIELWARVVAALGDPAFAARTGMAFELEALEGFGFLAMSCSTLAQAYERTRAYRALYNVGAAWELEPARRGVLRMRWEPWIVDGAPESGRRAMNEYQVGEMLASVRTLVAEPTLIPLRICFRHPEGPEPARLAAVYGLAPEHDAEFDGFEVGEALLTRPLALSNQAMRAYFERQCSEALARFETDAAVTGKVRQQLARGMDGRLPSMAEVARAVGFSVRSLHRALESEGTKWSTIVDDVRSEFARRYLARRGLAIGEVSYLVGFSDTSAFFKAFKRWTGKSPGEYRADLAM